LNLIDKIQQAVSRHSSAPAFLHNDHVLTYRQFYAFLCAAAQVLHERGIRPGDVVGLSLDQSPLHCVIMLALARLGAVSIPIHPLLERPMRMRVAAKYGVRAIISHRDDCRVEGIAFIRMDKLSTRLDRSDMDFTDYMPAAETPFRISLSSGTTGEPKGVLFTHDYLLDRIGKTLYECDSHSRVISFDLNFALGLVFAIGTLTVGGTVVFPRAYTPQGLIEAINLYAVSHVLLAPTVVMRMAALLQKEEGNAAPSLKHLRIVGETPSKALLDTLRTRFCPNVFVPYGLTEIGAISMATPAILAEHPDSAGRVLPGVEVEILGEDGEALPAGGTGEIRVKMGKMPTGYVLDEQQSALKFRDGWFYPGDHGRITAEGLLFIEGRTDDMINLDGHKLSPNYIEDVLVRHPEVREAVAFAQEDDSGVKLLAAAVIPRAEKIRLDDLAEYSRQQLGMFYPKRFFVMQDFPRTVNGKVLRGEIPAAVLKLEQ
jgi:acyl-coenzyme A synthetase/AMP-(fatty) acid ligase